MDLTFPLNYVDIHIVSCLPALYEDPIIGKHRWSANENELTLRIENVASYKTQNGVEVYVCPNPISDTDSIQLFLNGSVLGAVLHQRGIMPFHGSSFIFKDQGVLICGNSGVGKSSVVAAFCQDEGRLVNDDITPICFDNERIMMVPLSTKVKLWDDAISLLQLDKNGLKKIRPSLNKYYVSGFARQEEKQPLLHTFIVLRIHNQSHFEIRRPQGIERFNCLRHNIYRKIYLKGMPQTEKNYFEQLLTAANLLDVVVVFRPQTSNALETMMYIREHVLL
ncbi:MAG TPA: hypothetical protein DHW31_11575 [Bacteroides graminisolvens]|uniref:HPr kinase/phosphorylase C-terminal domain-containing protein n=1 Tax=Bacteroides graminisolvens TaxID=477666 RepID=A0A3D2SGK1_9BACE|nr:hypothetical protein [Bacteroides graminisolvens]